MIFLADDAMKVLKKMYIKNCIRVFLFAACLYTISKKVDEQDKKIKNLTKNIEELSLKGD